MLTWLRKRSGDRWVKALMIAVAVTFFGGFGLLSSARVQSCLGHGDRLNPGTILAMSGGEAITIMDFENRYARELWSLENRSPGLTITSEERQQLRENSMKNLVHELLLDQEAERLGIRVSDAEVQQFIAALFSDARGVFNLDEYRTWLYRSGWTESRFEESQRQALKRERVAAVLTAAIGALPEEVKERYAFYNQMLKFDYLVLDPARIAAEAKPSEEAIRRYYAEREFEFYYDEARRVEFLSWPLAEVMAGITVGADDLRAQFERNKLLDPGYRLSPEQVRISSIYVKADRHYASEEVIAEAERKIEEVHAKLQEPDADFASLAQTYSEDGTRNQGGDWGWFVRRADLNPEKFPELRALLSEELEREAFSLEPGQFSEPIPSDDGLRIIKVTEQKPPRYLPLEVVREEIEFELKKARAVMALRETTDPIAAAVRAGKSFEQAAREAGLELQTSHWFQARDASIFGLADSAAVIEEAFSPELKPGKISDPFPGDHHLYLIRVAEVKREWTMPLSEARPRIIEKIGPEVQLEHAQKFARKKLAALAAGELDLYELARQTGLEVLSTDFMPRNNAALRTAGIEAGLTRLALTMSEENPWPREPIVAGGKVIIFKLVSLRPADMSFFEQEKEQYRMEIIRAKRNEAVNAWLDRLEEQRVVYTESWQRLQEERQRERTPFTDEE